MNTVSKPMTDCEIYTGNRMRDRNGNLAWETAKQNCSRRLAHGHTPKGSKNGYAKLDEASVIVIRSRRKATETLMSLANDYGVSQAAISLACSGKNWGHIGIKETQT